MQVKEYTVYRHVFPNGKSYVGITCVTPYYYRWRAGSGYYSQPKIYNAIRKYGWKNIKHEILAQGLTKTQANLYEQEMIEKHNSIIKGYNISIGGGGTYGIPCSEATKMKIGNANTGKPCRSVDNFRKYQKEHGAWNKGGHLTPEQYRKIAEERKRRCSRAITAFDPHDFEKAAHFVSASEAAKHFGVSKNVISRCANGGRKTSAGYIWRYDNASI